jgi:hypothetical protein
MRRRDLRVGRSVMAMEDAGFTTVEPTTENQGLDDGGLPSADEVACLMSHRRFAAATVAAATGMAELYQGNRILNHLINDRARLLFGILALDLHFSGQPNGDQGFAVTQAQDTCVAHGICSAGRAAAMIALMRFGGYVEPLPSRDRRQRLYGVTDRLVAAHHERWRRLFKAIAMVDGYGAAAFAALDRPAFTRAYAHVLANDFRAGVRVMLDSAPELGLFAERNSGMIILFRLLADAGVARAPVPVSISALSHRYGVSRAHVSKLLRDAEGDGFLALAETGSYRATLTPRLIDAAHAFFATAFLYVVRQAAKAVAAMPAD